MKKILFTINFLTNGGPTRVLENIIKGMSLEQYDIYVLTLIDSNEEKIVAKFRQQGIKVIPLKYTKSLTEVLKNKKEIIKEISKIAPDVIHTHGIVTTLLVYNLKTNAKKITTIHNSIFEDYKYTYGTIKGLIYAYFHIYMLRKFDEVICCSKTSYDVLKKYRKNCKYIRNGIDISVDSKISRAEIRKELNISENDIVYVYGGAINARKQVCELVQLFNNHLSSNEYLLIVGDGPLKNEAEKLANTDHIKFLGFKKNIIDYFNASDIYVSNSSSEGFSISVIEALECNLLLLLSDIPSHSECFMIDNSFYIGEVFNEHTFADKKKQLIDNLQEKFRTNEFKDKYLSSNSMSTAYKKLY